MNLARIIKFTRMVQLTAPAILMAALAPAAPPDKSPGITEASAEVSVNAAEAKRPATPEHRLDDAT